MSKPESQGPPEQYYDEQEARKYSSNSRIRKVQYELAERAFELLELPEERGECLLLDIGCGSGLSGEVLTENGHRWVGVDISRHMLDIARDQNDTDGELLQADMGAGLPFRPATFDGAISVSAVQWLCHSNSKREDPRRRLLAFFESLFACLTRSARAVFQFYPESQQQCELISQQALRAGFQGGLVVDHPDSPKQRKVFLVLSAGKDGAIVRQPPPVRSLTANAQEEEASEKQQIQMIGRGRPQKPQFSGKSNLKGVGKKTAKRMERRRQKAAKKREQKRAERDEEEEGMEI